MTSGILTDLRNQLPQRRLLLALDISKPRDLFALSSRKHRHVHCQPHSSPCKFDLPRGTHVLISHHAGHTVDLPWRNAVLVVWCPPLRPLADLDEVGSRRVGGRGVAEHGLERGNGAAAVWAPRGLARGEEDDVLRGARAGVQRGRRGGRDERHGQVRREVSGG